MDMLEQLIKEKAYQIWEQEGFRRDEPKRIGSWRSGLCLSTIC